MAYEFYDILGIERTASQDEIKKAYRKKAMEHHPDRHKGDKDQEAMFKKVNEAYSVLSDESKKAHYDRFGSADQMGGGFSWASGTPFDFGDIFDSFFGGGFSSSGRRREVGEDIEIELSLTFAEAITGVKKEIRYKKQVSCSDCGGSGGKSGQTVPCSHCQGSGRVRERTQTIFGVMEQIVPCSHCGGRGKTIKDPCGSCHGKGKITESVTREIEVPAWIDNGMTIKLRSDGHSGRDGMGDLYIHFKIPEQDGALSRDWNDLIYTLDLDPVEFVLGTKKEIEMPILGKKPVEIKAGTEPGSELVFRGDWLPSLSRSPKWNLIIRLNIVIPKKLTKKERELYEEIARERSLWKHDERSLFEKLFD